MHFSLHLHEQTGGRLVEELFSLVLPPRSDHDLSPLRQQRLDNPLSSFPRAAEHQHGIGAAPPSWGFGAGVAWFGNAREGTIFARFTAAYTGSVI